MNQLIESCKNFESYPQNLKNCNAPIYRLKAYFDRLQSQHDRLFDAKQAAVDVLDYKKVNQGAYCKRNIRCFECGGADKATLFWKTLH